MGGHSWGKVRKSGQFGTYLWRCRRCGIDVRAPVKPTSDTKSFHDTDLSRMLTCEESVLAAVLRS